LGSGINKNRDIKLDSFRLQTEGMAAAWPTMKDDVGFADRMNGYPKYVASTTLEEGPWNATMIKGNIVEEVYIRFSLGNCMAGMDESSRMMQWWGPAWSNTFLIKIKPG